LAEYLGSTTYRRKIIKCQSSESMSNDNNDQPKTLSKKGLYAPLSVYRDQEDSSSSKKRKVAPSLKDSALVDFLYTVGRDHNRKATISVGKNNGCKPLSQNEVSDRIRQRALTLIGGGINTSISGEKSKKNASKATGLYQTMSNRKRKLRQERQESVGGSQQCPSTNTGDKLTEINRKWNDYVHGFLRDQGCDLQTKKGTRALTTMLTRYLPEVGIVGSFINIAACKSNKHIVSKRGFMVGETAHTWRVAVLPRGTSRNKLGKVLFKLRTVAKQGTRITLVLPLNTADPLSADSKSIYITLE
jgi:hypothetical protein